MANNIQFKLEGVEHILKELESIAHGKNAAERAALRGGSAPISKSTKRHAAKIKDTGLLAKSIGISVKKNKGVLSARVGPRGGFRRVVSRKKTLSNGMVVMRDEMANPVKYAHLVEYGTAHSSAKPFLRPAVEETKDQVVSAMAASLRKHIIRKQAREAAKAMESA